VTSLAACAIMSAMKRVILPTYSFDDLAEMERLARIERTINQRHVEPVKPNRKVRPGEEPSAYQAQALLLYEQTQRRT
jgi:hypothetical protein